MLFKDTKGKITLDNMLRRVLATAFVAKSACDVLSTYSEDEKTLDKLEDFFEDVIDHLVTQETVTPQEITSLTLETTINDILDLQGVKGMLVDIISAESAASRKVGNISLAVLLEHILLVAIIPTKKK
jgi:hypothetical protein